MKCQTAKAETVTKLTIIEKLEMNFKNEVHHQNKNPKIAVNLAVRAGTIS